MSATDDVANPTALVDSLNRLKGTAVELNAASDNLGKLIAQADDALKRLNLGVPAWIVFNEWSARDDSGWWVRHSLGYARVDGRWGIAVAIDRRNEFTDDFENEEWLFNDAPRWLRLQAIGKLTDLIDKMADEANETARAIISQTTRVEQIVGIINTSIPEPPAKRGRK